MTDTKMTEDLYTLQKVLIYVQDRYLSDPKDEMEKVWNRAVKFIDETIAWRIKVVKGDTPDQFKSLGGMLWHGRCGGCNSLRPAVDRLIKSLDTGMVTYLTGPTTRAGAIKEYNDALTEVRRLIEETK